MEQTEPIWSITEVNQAVRELIENSMTSFWLQGEVGTLSVYRSGHVYLTLKDSVCQLRATFFNGAARARALDLAVGMRVEAYGKLSVYPQRGDYQFNIRSLRIAGAGDLQREFEAIKNKLASEGLFDSSRKLPLPTFPSSVGVVTSPDGAAVRDFIRIAHRRAPWLKIRIYPATVQGVATAESVAQGIDFFNRPGNEPDVIVITRGGGSMEDLWGFNSEMLARTIAASKVPTVSAIGHEIDFTIADFAASLRAPTPSAAAEQITPERETLLKQLERLRHNSLQTLQMAKMRSEDRWARLAGSYVFREPKHLLLHQTQRLDECGAALERIGQKEFERQDSRLTEYGTELARNAVKQIELKSNRLDVVAARLKAVDPVSVLRRGFAILHKADGSIATSGGQLSSGEKVKVQLQDQSIAMTVD